MDIYLDGAATTPLLPEVRRVLTDAFDLFGNPSSLHRKGVQSEEAIAKARKQVLRSIGSPSGRLVFTGCGTEANNLAIFGATKQFAARGRHLVTTQIEHPSVLEAFKVLEREGWQVTWVKPDADGNIPAERVLSALTDDTVLVSMMHVNNETGAILPVEEIGRALADRRKTLFHVDGIQAFGKLENCAKRTGADLYSVSGHKIGAPKGIGALFIRDGLQLAPILHGGGQEYGLRSGTENILGILAMGAAAELAQQRVAERAAVMQRIADLFVAQLGKIPGCMVQRSLHASPYVVSASFPGLRGEVLLHALESKGVYVSTGSACSTHGGHAAGSHVLRAMGRSDREVTGTIRFSFGPWLDETDAEAALEAVREQAEWLYSLER